jgi:hypothetical protein
MWKVMYSIENKGSFYANRLGRLTWHSYQPSISHLNSGAFEAVLILVVLLLGKWNLYNCLIQEDANHRRRS